MKLNFYFDNLNFPDDVRKYDHVDVYPDVDCIYFECYLSGDKYPSRVFRFLFNKNNALKGVSFDG